MKGVTTEQLDSTPILAAQQPGPRQIPVKHRWYRWGLRLGLLLIIGGAALYYWRQTHTQMVYSRIRDRGGQIVRRLTEFQQFQDSLISKLTGKKVETDPNRGAIRRLVLLEPTEEELRVLSRETFIESLEIRAENLSPGIVKLISRQPQLARLHLFIPSIGEKQLLQAVQVIHQKAILKELSIMEATIGRDAQLNGGAEIYLIDRRLQRENLLVSDLPSRNYINPKKFSFVLGPSSITDATVDKLLAATRIDCLTLSSSGVSYEKLLNIKDFGELRWLNISNMMLTEAQVLKLSQKHPKLSIMFRKNVYEEGMNLGH